MTIFTIQYQLGGWREGCDVPCGEVHRASLDRKWVNIGKVFSAESSSRRQVPSSALALPPDLPADVHHRAVHLLAHRQQGQQPRGPRLQDEGGQPAVEGNPID